MLILTDDGNKLAHFLAIAVSKIASLEMVAFGVESDEELARQFVNDTKKLCLVVRKEDEVLGFLKDEENMVVLTRESALKDGCYCLTEEQLEENNAQHINKIMEFWGFQRKVLDDFRLVPGDDSPTPQMNLEFQQGPDYLTMRIKSVEWKNVDKFSKKDIAKAEKRLKQEFVEVATKLLKSKLMPNQ